MSTLETLLAVGVLLGAAAGYLMGRRAGMGAQRALEHDLNTARTELATLSARLDERDRSHALAIDQLKGARQELSDRFKALANEILDEKRKTFVAQNQQSMQELLTPLRTELDGFRKQVTESSQNTTTRHGELSEQLRQLRELNTRLGTETQQLTRALKGDNKQQGDWGEHVLEQLLQHAGLEEHVHFDIQPTYTGPDGGRLRPDIVLKLPGDRYLVIDSKVSLTAYAELTGAEDEKTRQALLTRHVESVRSHVRGLGEKAYDKLHGDKSPDFVVMFLPLEGAFLAALREAPELTADAWGRRVILVSPSTLLFVVRCVAQLWSTDKRVRNVQDIADRGAALYDKFRGFVDDLETVGKKLDEARRSYDSAFGKLSSGRGNLVRQVEMLRDLGVRVKSPLSQDLVERAIESDGEDDERGGPALPSAVT
jgi:DNA recombination protein RmuC